ncbi:hypothetical protein HPB47_004230 [Ixodes persulcatus]|uniref:Uncharacterized protein n=1 Tax=Ixodes persulcatus TaxID=34615 RepID=A0AC60PHA8_IXOPE|nr:hypothetical protein HPB47_004230 [Ixodes persulcatus]
MKNEKRPVGQAVGADLRKSEQTPSLTLELGEGVPIDVDLPTTSRDRRRLTKRDGPDPAPADIVLWMNVTKKRRGLNAGPLGVRELMSPLRNERGVEAEYGQNLPSGRRRRQP